MGLEFEYAGRTGEAKILILRYIVSRAYIDMVASVCDGHFSSRVYYLIRRQEDGWSDLIDMFCFRRVRGFFYRRYLRGRKEKKNASYFHHLYYLSHIA